MVCFVIFCWELKILNTVLMVILEIRFSLLLRDCCCYLMKTAAVSLFSSFSRFSFVRILFLVICDHWSLCSIISLVSQWPASFFINHHSVCCKSLPWLQSCKIVASDNVCQLKSCFGGQPNFWSFPFCHLCDITPFICFYSSQQSQTAGLWCSMARHPQMRVLNSLKFKSFLS